MRLRFYHNVYCWFGCPKNACHEAARWLTLLCKQLRQVLCGAEMIGIIWNLGLEHACDREDLWLKVSQPSASGS